MYFIEPFATGGDRSTIPVPTQPSGSVNYTEGFGPDYSLDITVYPQALAVPRMGVNGLFFDVTSAIQQIQQTGVPPFITTADNGGTPFPYAIGSYALYDGGSGVRVWQSLKSSNTTTPPSVDWQAIPFLISGTVAGTANAPTINAASTLNLNFDGTVVEAIMGAANSGAMTLKVGAATAVNVTIAASSGLVAVPANAVGPGMKALFIYDGTSSTYQLINPLTSPVITNLVSINNLQQNNYTYSNDSGIANALVYTPSPAYTSYQSGGHATISGNALFTNTTVGATLDVSGIGTIPIFVRDTISNYRDVYPTEIRGTTIYDFTLTSNPGGFAILENPSPLPIGYSARVTFNVGTTQTITAGSTLTQIQFDLVAIDPYGWWDALNFRFLPTFPGRYMLQGVVNSVGSLVTQYLSFASDSNSNLISNNGTASTAIVDQSIVIPGFQVSADGSSNYFYAAWSNPISATNSNIGAVGGPFTAVNTNFFQITYLGP